MEKIAVLDGYTLNPGDIDWLEFEGLGHLALYDRTSLEELVSRSRDCSCILVNKVPISEDILSQLPNLTYIGVLATGYDVVDVKAACDRGIVVTNIPEYGTNSVAQHTIALMLEFARGVGMHHQKVKSGLWSLSQDWCFSSKPMFEFSGKTLGIIGLGRIGRQVAKICASMGMKIIAYSPNWPNNEVLHGLQVKRASVEEIYTQSDVISLHCPLQASTYHMIDAEAIGLMKSNALIINTSRGELINNEALARALHRDFIGGAALDVLDSEPPSEGHPLLSAPNCLLTPHIGWNAIEARQKLMTMAADNLRAFLAGRPINVISEPDESGTGTT